MCFSVRGSLCFAGYVTTIIEDAKIYATHAKKSSVDADDIRLAIQCRMDQSFTSPPPRDVSHSVYDSFKAYRLVLNTVFLVSPGGCKTEEYDPSAFN